MTRREEFIADVRRAVGMSVPPSVQADSDRIDTTALAESIHKADLWLTANIVEQYEQSDWQALSQTDAATLDVAVSRFRAIAVAVPPNGPATQEQSDEARDLLLEIARIIGVTPTGG